MTAYFNVVMYEKYRWLYKSIEKMSLNNPSTEHFNWFLWGGSLVEFFMLVAIVALLLYGVWYSTSPFLRFPVLAINTLWHGVFILSISLWLLGSRFSLLPSFILFKNNLLYDDFSFKISIILVICTIVCLFLSRDFLVYEKINVFEYVIFILLSCLGGCWLVASYDFFTMYLAIELLSLPLYALASIKSRSLLSTEAGLKYFILGAFSSGVFLFGVSLIYFATGSLNFAETGQLFAGTSISLLDLTQGDSSLSYVSAYLIGVIMVLVGLLFKLTAVPFHMWAPDVYEGAPISVTAFFSILPKFAVIIFCCRFFFFTFYDMFNIWQPIILSTALISIVVAAFSALYQRKLKRFLAYSSIGHVGYMLLAFGTGTSEGLQSILVYIFIYLITSICVWSFILSLNLRKDNKNKKPFFISELNGLGVSNPLLAFTLTVIMFSIAGTPPLAGFIAKLNIFFCAIESSLFVLSFLGIITRCLSAFYYLRFIKIMYFDTSKSWTLVDKIDKDKSIFIGASLFFLVLLFIFPSPLFILSHEIAVWVLV